MLLRARLCQYYSRPTSVHWSFPTFGAVEPSNLIPAVFIVLAAALVKGTAAFGFTMVAAPFLLLMWEPKLMVPIIVPLFTLLDAMIVYQGRAHMELRRVLPMIGAAAVGIPLGTYALLSVPRDALTLAIGIVVLVFGVLLLVGFTVNLRREQVASGAAGFLSGVFLGGAGLSGPPVTLFMINQRWSRETFRSSQGLFHLAVDFLAVISMSVSGVLTRDTLLVDLALLPPVLLGYALSVVLLRRLNQELFRRITIFIVIVAAAGAVVSALVRV